MNQAEFARPADLGLMRIEIECLSPGSASPAARF
jgi:hypothetical protein